MQLSAIVQLLELSIAHCPRRHRVVNCSFAASRQSIDPSQQFTWEHSNLEVNKPKNRYANVIAYDHTRVILAPIEGELGEEQ